MRVACCIIKAIGIHSDLVTRTTFPRQQWLNQSVSIWRYTHIARPLLFLSVHIFFSVGAFVFVSSTSPASDVSQYIIMQSILPIHMELSRKTDLCGANCSYILPATRSAQNVIFIRSALNILPHHWRRYSGCTKQGFCSRRLPSLEEGSEPGATYIFANLSDFLWNNSHLLTH
jgi:hypothetical protein